MKTEFDDSDYGLNITIQPETVEEFATLLRYAKNANSEKPEVYISFKKRTYLNLWLRKRKPSVQNNNINPKTK
jgi:hypothetical protein